MAKKKDKIEVEVEAGGREIEIEIDPETGKMTVKDDEERDEPDESADDGETSGGVARERPKKRSRRFLRGLVFGGLVGAAGAYISKRADRTEMVEMPHPGASQEPSGGVLGAVRGRWDVARREASQAAREAEEQKRSRYAELTETER
jgi:hypothetical protein